MRRGGSAAGRGAGRATVTGTAGPVGAAFAVTERSWRCAACKAENEARRGQCSRCRARKPKGGGGKVWDGGAVTTAGGQDHGWREALDPTSKQLYYFNSGTGKTQWDRPAEMGAALAATGWYGRGKAGAQSRLDELNEEYLKRPAMQQVEEGFTKDVAYVQGTENFNIYYGRYNGEHWSRSRSVEPAKTRCKVSLHAGYTQADKRAGAGGGRFFCVQWIKGACFRGSKCNYFHRVPTYADVGRLEKDVMHDVFGRERHAAHRDDMQGVGSFNDPSRTLYVGKLQRTPYAQDPDKLKGVLEQHFGEFGEVENVNLVWKSGIAFVRFRFRSHAELAKEAMRNQALDHDEILDVKWAYDDPNPVAKEATRRANADAVLAAIKAAGHSTGSDAAFAQPADYRAGAAGKRPAQVADKGPDKDPALAYPDTDAQYPAKRTKTSS